MDNSNNMNAPTSDAIGAAALRKASWRLLPLLFLGYGFAYIDRLNIGFAALQMNEQLHFSATIYGLGGGLFFLSYALCEVPSNLLLLRFGARRWLARIMISWGLISVGMLFVTTPMEFYVMRFLLGAAEAGFFPGVIYYLTQWFPASYRGRAISRFYVAFAVSAAVMGALAGPLLGLDGHLGLAGWQWLFLVEGAPAVLLGAVILARLPDTPTEARWLTEAERAWIASRRVAEEAIGRTRDQGFARALVDQKVWLLGLCNICILGGSYAFNLSAPTVLKEVTNWSAGQVGLLVSGAALFGALLMVVNGARSDSRRERYLHTVAPLVVVAVAMLGIGLSMTASVAVPAFVLYTGGSAAVQATFWLIPSDSLRGRSAASGLAAIGCIGMLGAFVGPLAWGLAKDHTGSYQLGLVSISITYATAVLLLLLIRRWARTAEAATPAGAVA